MVTPPAGYPNYNGPIAALDFECSGHTPYQKSRAVEIGLVLLHPNGKIEVLADNLLSGATYISRYAYATHGISLKQCYGKPRLQTFRNLILQTSKWPICVHAKGTERSILRDELGITEGIQWVDSCLWSRKLLKGKVENHQLKTISHHLEVAKKLQEFSKAYHWKWHRAAFDAAASALIIQKLPTFLK